MNIFADFLSQEGVEDSLVFKNIYRNVIFSSTRKAYGLVKTTSLREYVSTMQMFFFKKDVWYPDLADQTFLSWLVLNKNITNAKFCSWRTLLETAPTQKNLVSPFSAVLAPLSSLE